MRDATVRNMTGLTEDEGRIVLADRVDIASASALRQAVLAAGGDIRLDAGAVIAVTSPGMQVLMAARDHMERTGRELRIDPVSAGFRTSARTLGVPLDRLRTSGENA